jgi:hypothetical protein
VAAANFLVIRIIPCRPKAVVATAVATSAPEIFTSGSRSHSGKGSEGGYSFRGGGGCGSGGGDAGRIDGGQESRWLFSPLTSTSSRRRVRPCERLLQTIELFGAAPQRTAPVIRRSPNPVAGGEGAGRCARLGNCIGHGRGSGRAFAEGWTGRRCGRQLAALCAVARIRWHPFSLHRPRVPLRLRAYG